MTDGERDRWQAAGLAPEAVQALVIGRVVQGGRGVWALGAQELVLLGQRYKTSVDRVPRSAFSHIESETGRYGETLRLQTREGRWAMYAVDAGRAQALVQQLRQG